MNCIVCGKQLHSFKCKNPKTNNIIVEYSSVDQRDLVNDTCSCFRRQLFQIKNYETIIYYNITWKFESPEDQKILISNIDPLITIIDNYTINLNKFYPLNMNPSLKDIEDIRDKAKKKYESLQVFK